MRGGWIGNEGEEVKYAVDFYVACPNFANFPPRFTLLFITLEVTLLTMNEASMTKKRLGELLRQADLITQSDLERAIEEQRHTGKRMGEALVDLKIVTEFDIANVLSTQLGISYLSLEMAAIEPDAIAVVPENIALKYTCIPTTINKRQLSIAMVDPLDFECIKDIHFRSNFEVKPLISTRREILAAIKRYYRLDDSVENILHATEGLMENSTVEIFPTADLSQEVESEDLEKKGNLAPIVRLFNTLVVKAMRARASDIHLDAHRIELSVRFRIDGILHEEMTLPKWVQAALVSRIKVLSSLDISERRLPQDGAIRVRLDNRDVDLRISTLPTHYGEKVVIRILDQKSVPIGLKGTGLSGKDLEKMLAFTQKRQGILLVTGPTGSGKTSTLYAFINQVRSEAINIMTVEDPIEYDMPGLNQIQVKPEIGLTFANCLRSILRQDPNVVMLGEIRDLETAEIAFRAAMTGHLVISTLHTNDAISTVTRMLDMGIPKYLVAANIIGVVAQRLVRKVCHLCKASGRSSVKEVNPPIPHQKQDQNGTGEKPAYKACQSCKGSGFLGRIGIFEVLPFGKKIKEMVASGRSEEEIRKSASDLGMTTMSDDGFKKVRAGLTTLEEVLRVIEVEEEGRVVCPQCKKAIHSDYVVCPHCKFNVQLTCNACQRQLQPEWCICPYCRHSVGALTPPRAQPLRSEKSLLK